ncbi:MAG TPA: helix-turn-helix transcriptional regulator, partial [Candidatus Eremiobacteraceae bacterium]|nr:helix-turn-helix transcriptional regulator [Candidatus Eremiobacteraceae bacterium]
MTVEPDIAAAAALIGDPARAAMISVLSGGEAYPASVLALRAGISAQTASAHLAKLVSAGMVAVAKNGRLRLYSLSSYRVADAFEALASISPPKPARSPRLSGA